MSDVLDSKIISTNPSIGQVQKMHFHEDGALTIETVQDITDIAEANKAQYNAFDERSNWKGDLHKVASIPMSVYYDLKRQGILDDPVAMKAWLNNPDNRVFRTRPGQV
jgi:hypothetical protein